MFAPGIAFSTIARHRPRPVLSFQPAGFLHGRGGALLDPQAPQQVFGDVAGTSPATIGGPVARVTPTASSADMSVTQATSLARPVLQRLPAGAVRNRANGSAAVSNAAFWPASAVQNGITMTRVAQGLDTDGLPFVDLRYQGVANTTFNAGAYTFANSVVPAQMGQTFTASMIARRIAGSTAGVSGFTVSCAEINSTGGFLGSTDVSVLAQTTDTLLTATRTLSHPTMASVRTGVTLLFTNGATIDVTYRCKGLQLESGPARTAFQRNMSAFDVTEDGVAARNVLAFDGVDDRLNFATPALGLFAGAASGFVAVGLRRMGGGERTGIGFAIGTSSAERLAIGTNASGQWRLRLRRLDTDAPVDVTAGVAGSAPTALIGVAHWAAGVVQLHINGALAGSASFAAGATSAAASASAAIGGTGAVWQGSVGPVIAGRFLPSQKEIADMTAYLLART